MRLINIILNKNKKAQTSGAQAAALVGLILILMIVYVLFIPESERNELLGEEEETTSGTNNVEEEGKILLSENIGSLSYLKEKEYEIGLSSFKLFKTTNAEIIKRENPFIVRNGWFDKKTKEISFKIDDLNVVDNVILSFNAKTRKGILTIKLNDNILFEDRVTRFNNIVYIPKDNLKNENSLEFSVSGVGARFWRTNEYSVEDVKITADITDISRQETKNTFYIEEWKYDNLEKATLKFTPYCNPNDVGILNIELNKRNIFSGVPDCDSINRIDIDPYVLNAGTNKVIFKTEKGSYLVDLIKVILELKKASNPVYYFELNETETEEVMNNSKEVLLSIEFVDDNEYKTLDLVVNGHKRRIDQKQESYERDISEWVEEGNNYIELIPKTDLEIINLKVELKEK